MIVCKSLQTITRLDQGLNPGVSASFDCCHDSHVIEGRRSPKDPKLFMIRWLAERCTDEQLQNSGLERKRCSELRGGFLVSDTSCLVCNVYFEKLGSLYQEAFSQEPSPNVHRTIADFFF